MPKNNVSDLITDQEMAFAHLVFSGKMTDQRAAKAVGLNPNTAASTKSKPCVRAYMLELRAAVQQRLVEQQTESLRPLTPGREQVLDRLWELARIGPEITRGSITGQVKAMSMIVAIEGLIPDRRAGSADKNPVPPSTEPKFYQSKWLREQLAKAAGTQPNAAPDQGNQQDQDEPIPIPDPGAVFDQPTFATPASLSETETEWPPYAAFPPDTRVPFSIKKNPFARRRF